MKDNNIVFKSLVTISQFGINMLVPIFLCTFLGLFIDRKLGTSFVAVILFFVGALAGFRNNYIFAKKIYEKDKNEHKEEGRKGHEKS